MSASSALHARASRVSPGGVHGAARYYEPYPRFFARMDRQFLWDVDGEQFLDLHGSFGAVALGHNDPHVRAQVERVLATDGVLFGTPHRREVELAEQLVDLIPCADMVGLCGGGGSDPLFFGYRLARAVTGRKRMLKFEGEYHGWNDPLAVSIHPDHDAAGSVLAPTPVAASAGASDATTAVVIGHLNNVAFLEEQFRRWGEELACAVIEPICHTSGAIPIDTAFLQRLRDLCDEYGVVLMFDEIITGFRHSVHGAQSLVGVTPDLAAFGKALGNGFPISLLAGKRELMEGLSPIGPSLYSGTYCGHLISVTAALATLEEMRQKNIHEHTFALGSQVTAGMNAVIEVLGVPAVCQGYGSIFCLYLGVREVRTYRDVPVTRLAQDMNRQYREALLERGIFMHANFINRCFLTAAHTNEDVDRVIEASGEFLDANRMGLSRLAEAVGEADS